MKAILHPYQQQAVDYILTHPVAGLFLDMGLGKTLITLTALQQLAIRGQINGHVLIIAPKRIAVNTWPSEIDKWDHLNGTSFKQLSGISKKKRDLLYDELHTSNQETKEINQGLRQPTDRTVPASLYFINRELIPDLVKNFEKEWPFTIVIIDELQSFKGYNSTRFKALRKVRNQIDRIIGLTGTPAPNSLMDLWAQITLLDNGQRLGKNITNYRNTFFYPGRRTDQGYPYEWILKPDAENAIYHNIDDIVISMKSNDYLQLPPVTFNTITVDMDKKERNVYNQLKKEHVLSLVDGSEIDAVNAAVLVGKLLQLANGALYADDTKTDIVELHQHKLDALEEIIDSSQGQPLLVFYWFKHDLARLKERFPEGIEFDGKPQTVAAWNNKQIPLMFLQPSSAGHGLNLQEGGHIIVWFALPFWSLELYQQGNARVARQGQTQPVIIHHILTHNTVDQQIINALMDKDEQQTSLIDAVKLHL